MTRDTRLLRVAETAARLGVTESAIRKAIFQRRIPVVRIGRAVRIPEDHIEKLIRDGYTPAVGQAGKREQEPKES